MPKIRKVPKMPKIKVFCLFYHDDRAKRYHTSTFDIRYSAVLRFAFQFGSQAIVFKILSNY